MTTARANSTPSKWLRCLFSAALLVGSSGLAHAQITAPGTDYVSFWSGDLRIVSQSPSTQVLIVDIDTNAPLDLAADPRVTSADINGVPTLANPFVLPNTGDMWRATGGLGNNLQEIRVRVLTNDDSETGAARPVTLWTGSSLANTSNAWGSLVPAAATPGQSFGREVGRNFFTFLHSEVVITAPRAAGAGLTTVSIEKLSPPSTTLLTFDNSILPCPLPFPPPASITCYMLDHAEVQSVYINGLGVERAIVRANTDISLLTGLAMFHPSAEDDPNHLDADWSYSPPSFAPGEDGAELGTEFYFAVRETLTIFPTVDNTTVTITDLSDGDDSKTFTLANGSISNPAYDLYTTFTDDLASGDVMLPRPADPAVTITENNAVTANAFENDMVKIVSDHPILVLEGPAGSDVREYADVAFSVPTGPDSRLVYAYAQNQGASNDLQLFALQRDTRVKITSLTRTRNFGNGQFHDFEIDFDVPPGTQPQVSASGGPFGPCVDPNICVAQATAGDIQHFGSGIWGAELLRIESNRPILVISGDYDFAHFGAFVPFVQTTVFLPPKGVVTANVRDVCPGDSISFDASGSFDQDSEGPAPDITRYDWNFGDGTMVPDGGATQSHAYGTSGLWVATVTVTDNESGNSRQTDTASVRVNVRPASDPRCNQPPIAQCKPVDVCAGTIVLPPFEVVCPCAPGSIRSARKGDSCSVVCDLPEGLGNFDTTICANGTNAQNSLSDDEVLACLRLVGFTGFADCTDRPNCDPVNLSCSADASINDGSFDPDGDPVTITETPDGPYSIGVTPVTLTIDDGIAQDMCTENITVRDCEPPAITCPPDVTEECTTLQAIADPGDATATDSCSATVTVVSPGPASFPFGDTDVTHRAFDQAQNASSCTNTIHVVDTLDPEIACPPDQVIECALSRGCIDIGNASATDRCSLRSLTPGPGPACYSFGGSSVAFEAVDHVGRTAACTTTVTVGDTIPPEVSCSFDRVPACKGVLRISISNPATEEVHSAGNGVDKLKSNTCFDTSAGEVCVHTSCSRPIGIGQELDHGFVISELEVFSDGKFEKYLYKINFGATDACCDPSLTGTLTAFGKVPSKKKDPTMVSLPVANCDLLELKKGSKAELKVDKHGQVQVKGQRFVLDVVATDCNGLSATCEAEITPGIKAPCISFITFRNKVTGTEVTVHPTSKQTTVEIDGATGSFHTSCSQQLCPGDFDGDIEIVAIDRTKLDEKHGTCSGAPRCAGDLHCDGGGDKQDKPHCISFITFRNKRTGTEQTVNPTSKQTDVEIDGATGSFHTSCSQQLCPGDFDGDIEIVAIDRTRLDEKHGPCSGEPRCAGDLHCE